MKDRTPPRCRHERTGVPSCLDHSSLLFRKLDWGWVAIETMAARANLRGPRPEPPNSPVDKIEGCRPRGREETYLERKSKALF